MRRLTIPGLLLLSAGLLAAENTPPQTTPETEEELKAAAIEPPINVPANTDLILADIDEDTDQDAENERNSRFIPTEEISQDLGVSFPVDI